MRSKHYAHPEVTARLDYLLTRDNATDTTWGRALGIDRKTVLSYRHGVSQIPVDVLRKVCELTHTSADWVLFGKEE